MAKKIADLEKELNIWKERAEEQAERLRSIAKEEDELFSHSHLKDAMQKEIDRLNTAEKWNRESRWALEGEVSRLKKSLAKALEDNAKLCKEQNIAYKIGMTSDWEASLKPWERRIKLENEQLKREIASLEGRIEEQNKYIDYLRGALRDQMYESAEGYVPEALAKEEKSGRRGRPSVTDEATRKRMKKMRKDGYTVRRIAEIERVSPATVQKIVGKRR